MDIKTALQKVDSLPYKEAMATPQLVGSKRKKAIDIKLEQKFRKLSIESDGEDNQQPQ